MQEPSESLFTNIVNIHQRDCQKLCQIVTNGLDYVYKLS